MGDKKRLISVVTVAIFLIVMGIAATGFPAQKTTAAQQQPAVQQQTPVKTVAAPIRVTATLGVKPASYTGNCPALISFRGHITVNQPTTVQYKFIRSDNASAPVQTLNFPKAGTQEVTTTWQLGGPSLPTFSGWQAIEVISPVSVKSNKADFKIRCASEGQQGGTGQQGQQTGQQEQQAIPVVVKTKLDVSPVSYSGNCPALISFKGKIWVNQPTTVQYKFIRSDNANAPVQTLNFPKAGTQEVTTTWQLGGASLPTYSGWEAIEVISPVSVQSNKANFKIRCTGEGQQGSTTGQQGQLPDLTIEDITLTEGCFVVVTAKNNGPGTVPDKVWTDHAPDSSAVYLYINGKKWGGETIWHFDPSKNLQNPGGTATMVSNLKVTGTATIGATIDSTGKVKEVNEKNNAMKKQLTCQPVAATQPGVVAQLEKLPDLTIEDITLNAECFVVIKAKNNGPGTVPDKVWTDHAPDSSAVYLYINGKRWGGESIWGFDPAKNLQKPGGTATMTSKLKVTDTATIEAVIDHTGKVKETDEKNNAMKKGLTCKAVTAVQPGVVVQPGVTTQPVGTAQPAVGKEDCISFNPATTTVQQLQGSWKVVDGSHWMFDFGAKKADADRTLAIIKHYRMNQSCYVGRPNAPFHYMLVSGTSPVGSYADEDCVSFNPATTTVQQIKGNWKVVDGSHWMFDFGAKKAEADQTLAIIKKYGFTYSCYVGRPGPNFTYLRK